MLEESEEGEEEEVVEGLVGSEEQVVEGEVAFVSDVSLPLGVPASVFSFF